MKLEQGVLVADEGYYLTQANRKDEEMPKLLTKVYLSGYDSADNYIEVTHEEGERLLKEWEDEYLKPLENESNPAGLRPY